MNNKNLIKKISSQTSCLFWEQSFSENLTEKSINVFYMGNRQWKTLLYTLIHSALSGEKEYSINNEYDLSLSIESCLFGDSYYYLINKSYLRIRKNEENITNDFYVRTLNNNLNIYDDLKIQREKNEERKNTLRSMFRYIFYSDNDVWKRNRWEIRELWLVNTYKDWCSKKILLAYFLWLKIDNQTFTDLYRYYKLIDDINRDRKEYEKYKDITGLFLSDNSNNLFEQYSYYKKLYWDISVAIEHIDSMFNLAKVLNNPKDKEKKDFLRKQMTLLNKEKKYIFSEMLKAQGKLRALNEVERMSSKDRDLNDKFVKEYVDKVKEMETIGKKYENVISEIDWLLVKCSVYIKKQLGELWYKNLDINLLEQKIKSTEPRSEWEMSVIRILCWILLNVFSQQNNWRLLNICCFDAIFQWIDENNWHDLFTKINDLYNSDLKLYLPQIFIFITWITDRYNLRGLNNIEVYEKEFIIPQNPWNIKQ